MSDSNSTFVFAGYREAQQKFDYFVTGVAGALFAYIAQTYSPKKIGLDPSTIEPIALLFLAVSFFYGVKRIENTVVIGALNHDMLDAEEKAGSTTEAIAKGFTNAYNSLSGSLISGRDLPSIRGNYMQQAQSARTRIDVAAKRGLHYYKFRNMFLFAGFAAIFLAKLLQPYA